MRARGISDKKKKKPPQWKHSDNNDQLIDNNSQEQRHFAGMDSFNPHRTLGGCDYTSISQVRKLRHKAVNVFVLCVQLDVARMGREHRRLAPMALCPV